jgi:hypothetical protein
LNQSLGLVHCSDTCDTYFLFARIQLTQNRGAPARKEVNGKKMAVPGCKIFVGGTIGEEGHLSLEPFKENIPLDEEDLIPVLVDILKTQFGATDKKR